MLIVRDALHACAWETCMCNAGQMEAWHDEVLELPRAIPDDRPTFAGALISRVGFPDSCDRM